MPSRLLGLRWPRRSRGWTYFQRRCNAPLGSAAVVARRLLATERPQRAYDGLWANTTFEELGVHPQLVQALAAQDIVRPTVVQAEAFQPLIKGQDAILCAETGSGKTLAFLLPLVNRMYHLHDRAREVAKADSNAANPLQRSRPWVVLVPTSDLCAQILAMLENIDGDRLVAAQSLQRLFKWEALGAREPAGFQAPMPKERTTLQPAASAGVAIHSSRNNSQYAIASPRIKWGAVDLIVSTPIKFCEDLARFKDDGIYPACIVMDEADALFHGPSRTYLYDIFNAIRPRLKIRQPDEPRRGLPDLIPTQFVFSAATMIHIGPFSVGNMIIERFCTAHVVQTPHFHRLPSGISQESLQWLEGSDDWDRRIEQLVGLLRSVPCERTLVFVNTIQNCHVLLKFLRSNGWPVTSFMKGPEGRMGPRFRDAQKFVDGEFNILIATDFGGRGIDWPDVDHVINFQMPTNAVLWLHRIGRTGRIGQRGLVSNFVGGKDQTLAHMIQERMQSNKEFHGVFSRKRSLRKRLKVASSEQDSDTLQPCHSDEGTYRLEGGLELYADGLATGTRNSETTRSTFSEDASSDGTLIGYLSVEEPGEASQGKRRGKEGDADSGADGSDIRDNEDDDAVADFRRRLLESDSDEGSDISGDDSGEDGEEQEPPSTPSIQRSSPMQYAEKNFSWSMLGDTGQDAVVASPPKRRVLNRGEQIDDAESLAQRYSRRSERYVGSRKGQGIAAVSRARSGRNYSDPDDDLLPL